VTDPRTGDPANNAAAALVVAGLVLTRRKR